MTITDLIALASSGLYGSGSYLPPAASVKAELPVSKAALDTASLFEFAALVIADEMEQPLDEETFRWLADPA